MAEAGARLAIRLLQDAAERGEIDPWDVDVIAVVDGFLDQLRQRIGAPRLVSRPGEGGSFESDLAVTSEAFLAASVLVSLKAEILEQQTLPPEPETELEAFPFGDDDAESFELLSFQLPRRPERHLLRRAVAPPPLQRPVTLGELIRQLEDISERLEQGDVSGRTRQRGRRYSERAAIEQVAALAHREKLPETTAALSHFLLEWQAASDWVDFELLVEAWAEAAPADLDQDRVGVFWALLFLCSQGKVDLQQGGDLFGPLFLRGCLEEGVTRLPSALPQGLGPAPSPAREARAA
ncbi:segregation/condensation protein A [Synechococcus sp. RedBA-s]|uniref:segregation/condensation protein A n=1 Tax=Synechococcus sp. RedBA-s TaxID=2823741 RepID=UPI0020CF40A8|nr:segregation/condensation protein A [Synechococcus sp. RedBA-s]MCP9801007.1 segregation/condensation protein A [Synechococcus sp. RedBA-s]